MTRVVLLLFAAAVSAQADAGGCQQELTGWRMCRESAVPSGGAALSALTFPLPAECIPAAVPGTALESLLLNNSFGNVTDPYFEDNLDKLPDIFDVGAVRDFATVCHPATLPPLIVSSVLEPC